MSALAGGWIRRNARSMDARVGCLARYRACGRHPFVPAGLAPVAHDIVHRPLCRIITTVRTRRSDQSLLRAISSRVVARHNVVRQAACSACWRCQRRSRFQQISASFRAAATRAILALDRLRTRW